jgi:hypothetical protein
MAYTTLQQLRRARAKNKGVNRRLARALRKLADILDRKASGEFSKLESRILNLTADELAKRITLDEMTRGVAERIERERRRA